MAAVSAEVMPTDTVSTDITPTEAMTIVAKSAEHMPVEFMPTEFIQTEVMQTATALSSPLSEPSSELAINCSMDPVTEPEMESLMLSPPDVTMSGNDSSSDDKEGLSTPSTPIDDEVANIEILEVEGMAAMSPEVMALMGDRLPAPKYSARQSKQPVRYGYDSEPANPTKRKAQNIAQDSAVARNIRPRISKASPSPAHHIDEKANGVSDEGRAILDSGMQAMVGTQDVSGELEVNTNVAIGQGTGQHLAMSDASLKTADGLSIILPREATLGLRTQLLHSHGSVNQDGSFPCTTSWDTNADKDSTEILSKVKKDRQIKSAYGISSLRILQGQILVRKACAWSVYRTSLPFKTDK